MGADMTQDEFLEYALRDFQKWSGDPRPRDESAWWLALRDFAEQRFRTTYLRESHNW